MRNNPIKILVDADACPRGIKEILKRTAKRMNVLTIFFANHALSFPASQCIEFILVSAGFDKADNAIIEKINKNDLVITADIPLAAAAIEKDAFALNPRGTFYDKENIQQKLALRNWMQTLRDSGQITGGPPTLRPQDHQQFANALDRFLSKHHHS